MTSSDPSMSRFAGPERIKPGGRARAQRLRTQATWTETEVWKALRRLPVPIRRQAPIGPYVADFACLRAKLVIEIDGGIHDLSVVAARDAERDAWLASQGFQVLRIDARRIPSQATAVIEDIIAALRARIPLPLEGEGVRGWGGGTASPDAASKAKAGQSQMQPNPRGRALTPTQPSPLEGEGS